MSGSASGSAAATRCAATSRDERERRLLHDGRVASARASQVSPSASGEASTTVTRVTGAGGAPASGGERRRRRRRLAAGAPSSVTTTTARTSSPA